MSPDSRAFLPKRIEGLKDLILKKWRVKKRVQCHRDSERYVINSDADLFRFPLLPCSRLSRRHLGFYVSTIAQPLYIFTEKAVQRLLTGDWQAVFDTDCAYVFQDERVQAIERSLRPVELRP
jgi:hypothetical protein